MRWNFGAAAVAAGIFCTGGCPQALPPVEYVAGTTGQTAQLGATAVVDVLAPVSDFSISGGTPVEVAWRNQARTRIATIEVFVDVDTNPHNGNEILAGTGLPLDQTSLVVDTTRLAAGFYFLGVRMREVGQIVASDYATGRITVNQRATLFFTSPRDNFVFDRSVDIAPSFDVAWTVSDPDSVFTVQIFLDPDSTPNGNEILLRESNSQTGDRFQFNLPTASFAPGAYRILALVSDGIGTASFYAPGSIRLLARLAGNIDLRDIDLPTATVRGAVFEGFNPFDNAGSRVERVGDLDNDGFDDFIIVAQFGKPDYGINLPRTGIGEAYLIYGRPQRFSGRVSLNSTGTLFRGEVFGGVEEVPDPIRPSRGITSVAVLDDWDRDGVRELAFGLPFTDSLADESRNPLDANGYFRTGGVIILSGSVFRPDLGFPGGNIIELSDIGTSPYLPITCGDCTFQNLCQCPEGFYGPKAPESPGNCATTYFNLHVAPPIENGESRIGCRFSTIDFGDQCGESLAPYDFDGIIISSPNRDAVAAVSGLFGVTSRPGAGVVSVYFNNTGNGSFQWTALGGPPAGPGYAGPQGNSAGLGIPHGGPFHYVLDDNRTSPVPVPGGGFRQASPGYIATIDATPCVEPSDVGASPTPTSTVRLYGGFDGARIGNAVGAGDFNDDGIEDILVGSPLSHEGAGSVFVVLGRSRQLVRGGDLNLEELSLPLSASPGQNRRLFDGVRILGAPGDRLGQAQDSVGDFNGDGVPDLLIGSPLINNRRGGAAVVFGNREVINLTEDEIPFSELASREMGVNFVGEEEGDFAGARVTGIGDLDGDGLGDILIAAPNKSIKLDIDLDGEIEIDRTNCGVVYLVYGSPRLRGTIDLKAIGTAALPGARFIGAASGHSLGAGLGDQGDQSTGISDAGDVDGDGRTDLLLSAVQAAPRGGRTNAGEVYLLYGVGE